MSDASDAGDASERGVAGAAAGRSPTDVLLDAHRRLLRSLGETHACILSIELRMKRTDESVSGLAQRLKVQGQVMQRLERRTEVLEARWLAHVESVALRAAENTPAEPGPDPRAAGPPCPDAVRGRASGRRQRRQRVQRLLPHAAALRGRERQRGGGASAPGGRRLQDSDGRQQPHRAAARQDERHSPAPAAAVRRRQPACARRVVLKVL